MKEEEKKRKRESPTNLGKADAILGGGVQLEGDSRLGGELTDLNRKRGGDMDQPLLVNNERHLSSLSKGTKGRNPFFFFPQWRNRGATGEVSLQNWGMISASHSTRVTP